MTKRKPPLKTQRLGVFMNGVLAGCLEKERNGALSFTYDPVWIERPNSIPISRNFPLRESSYSGEPVRNYFGNLLPDDRQVLERVAARAHADGTQSFDILAAIGRDCIGALQFYPEGEQPGSVKSIQGKKISNAKIAELLRNLPINPLGISREQDFRISLAGAQRKTALLRFQNEWLLPQGATPTTHILKPPINLGPDGIDLSLSVENEWLCLRLLNAYGLKVAQADIAEFDGIKVLVVERFDRKWSGKKLYRLPQEDICQAMGIGSHMKYESDGGPGIKDILNLLNESDQRNLDRKQFMKAQLLFWLISAIDGHAKNFSLFIRPQGFGLTPLYDVMSAEPHVNPKTLPKQKMKLAMAVGKNRHYNINKIALRHWYQTAHFCKFDGLKIIIEELIADTPKVINAVSREIPQGFPEVVSESIFRAMSDKAKLLEKQIESLG